MKRMMRRAMGRAWLKASGWKLEGERPSPDKYVLIAAPHTSNWDLPFTLAVCWSFDVDIQWMGKHTIFEGPFGFLFKAMGGVPVYRHERRNMVQQMIERFENEDDLVLIVATAGTRKWVPYWKSGFYNIAKGANVPLATGFLDYKTKRGGFGPMMTMTGDIKKDMDAIRAFYEGKTGDVPEYFGPIIVKEEMTDEEYEQAKEIDPRRRPRA